MCSMQDSTAEIPLQIIATIWNSDKELAMDYLSISTLMSQLFEATHDGFSCFSILNQSNQSERTQPQLQQGCFL